MARRNKLRTIEGETNLAARIKLERARRRWSPADLAMRMTAVGCSISTSAIYKIEGGDPPRRIAVDELIALAQVFETTELDLLTPVELLEQERAQKLLTELDDAEGQLRTATIKAEEAYVRFFELGPDSREVAEYVRRQRSYRRGAFKGDPQPSADLADENAHADKRRMLQARLSAEMELLVVQTDYLLESIEKTRSELDGVLIDEGRQ